MSVHSKTIVIDADIARAAGDSPDTSATGKSCRDFLQAVLEICHRAVWTAEIAEEWKRHASRFTRKWRVRMAARKKLDSFEVLPVAGLESRVISCNESGLNPVEITKDMHLVYAAIATSSPIASLDRAIQRRLIKAIPKAPELKTITWVNPSNDHDEAIGWLKNGAISESGRQLGETDSE